MEKVKVEKFVEYPKFARQTIPDQAYINTRVLIDRVFNAKFARLHNWREYQFKSKWVETYIL